MESPANSRPWMRWTGRILALLWAAFWTWFGIASGFGEGLDLLGILMHTLVPGLLFSGFVAVVWKWQRVGALLLIGVGAFIAVAYPIFMGQRFPLDTIVFMELTIALPPLLAGLLLYFSAQTPRLTPAV